jgi:hypothetical protein
LKINSKNLFWRVRAARGAEPAAMNGCAPLRSKKFSAVFSIRYDGFSESSPGRAVDRGAFSAALPRVRARLAELRASPATLTQLQNFLAIDPRARTGA